MTEAGAVYPPLDQRPMKNTICLFDVDMTLTRPRCTVKPEMLALLSTLRQKCVIAFVGGSNLVKQQEQLGTPSLPVTSLFDYSFAENGLTSFRNNDPLPAESFITYVGEEKYKKFINFILHYLADLEVPVKRGTFVEFRKGMINVSPLGRNATKEERDAFEAFDKMTGTREKMIEVLKKEFPDLGCTFSIGGQISFDVFPTGWDKTYCLKHLENEAKQPGGVEYKTIHFFGDKTFKGGNDYEIFIDPKVTGHTVQDPDDCYKQLKEMFNL